MLLTERGALPHLCGLSPGTLCDPVDCSPPGPSVHGVSQKTGVVAISSSSGSSRSRDGTHVSRVPCTGRRVLYD